MLTPTLRRFRRAETVAGETATVTVETVAAGNSPPQRIKLGGKP
ncbi:hypothetical protein [Lyngbya sp. CCY1209]|nr:hypothetical protein [Lyngbya sp. CCY1209]